jgi:hypothetical protein
VSHGGISKLKHDLVDACHPQPLQIFGIPMTFGVCYLHFDWQSHVGFLEGYVLLVRGQQYSCLDRHGIPSKIYVTHDYLMNHEYIITRE